MWPPWLPSPNCRPTVASQHLSKTRLAGLVERQATDGECSTGFAAATSEPSSPKPSSMPTAKSAANPSTTGQQDHH